MTTLPWGASLDSLLAETPCKQPAVVLATMAEDLRAKLHEQFADGQNPKESMPSLCEVVVAWLTEASGSAFQPLPEDANEMTRAASLCLQLQEQAGVAARAARQAEKDKQLKLEQADQAVSKALQTVISQGGSATSAASTKQVTERMGLWKKSIQDAENGKVSAARVAADLALGKLDASMKALVEQAHVGFLATMPQGDTDMILAAMIEEVQKHMEQLNVDCKGAGTGGTEQPSGLELPTPVTDRLAADTDVDMKARYRMTQTLLRIYIHNIYVAMCMHMDSVYMFVQCM